VAAAIKPARIRAEDEFVPLACTNLLQTFKMFRFLLPHVSQKQPRATYAPSHQALGQWFMGGRHHSFTSSRILQVSHNFPCRVATP
jgi:hypothetical protein